MSKHFKIFLAGATVVVIGMAVLFITNDASIASEYNFTSNIVPSHLLSTAASSTISNNVKKALLTSSGTILKAPVPITLSTIQTSTPTLVATTTPDTSTAVAAPSNADPASVTFDPQALVGILCYYNATYTNQNSGKSIYQADDEEVRGSGVFINSNGIILTNRHIIQQPQSYTSISDSNGNTVPISIAYALDHCEVGQLPKGSTLPSANEIQSLNPYINIPVLGYVAQPVYVSQTAGLSATEIQYADFALLKITGVSASGPTFGVTSVPSSFPYAQLLPVQQYPDVINSEVITYGFPGDVTSGQGNFFQTLTMTGSVGTVNTIYYGDQYYANIPLSISTDLAIAHGRSGSPLLWHGYVIGIVTFFIGENQTNSGSVASDAIVKDLKHSGYIQ